MKPSWLESKTMSTLFSYSAWLIVCLGIFMIFGLTPWFQQIETFHAGKMVVLVLGGTLAIVNMPALLIIIFGMAIFCVFRDRSSVGIKILWFIFFFFTAPFGSTVYFFSVYRKQVGRAPAALPSTQ